MAIPNFPSTAENPLARGCRCAFFVGASAEKPSSTCILDDTPYMGQEVSVDGVIYTVREVSLVLKSGVSNHPWYRIEIG